MSELPQSSAWEVAEKIRTDDATSITLVRRPVDDMLHPNVGV